MRSKVARPSRDELVELGGGATKGGGVLARVRAAISSAKRATPAGQWRLRSVGSFPAPRGA
jgi:hypothetical protein